MILSRVGGVILQLPDVAPPIRPTCIIIAEDCFQLSSTPFDVVTGTVIKAVEKLYGGEQLILLSIQCSCLLIIKTKDFKI